MVEETTLARRDEETLARHEAPLARYEPLSQEDIEILRGTVCAELTDAELKFFLRVCAARRLNPLAGQIHAIKRKSGDSGEKKMTIQTSIDGFRLIAERTHRYCPGRESTFAYDKNGKLVSATSYVLKLAGGEWHEVAESARFDEFCQMYNGRPQRMWATMPHVMLSKVSEARCLRRAFPEELMGVYTDDEMAQADSQHHRPTAERTAKATQSHETAPSYAAATIVPETEEARRERALARLKALLREVTERGLWDREDLDLARWADYDFSAGTAEEVMEDAEALEVVLQIARRAEGYEQEEKAPLQSCSMCAKPLTKGQYEVSLRGFNRPLCPLHQKEAARG